MSQLTIYKASAGSGKTYSLTKEFLILLFRYPKNYRKILAVTFTNKATAEMKSRILSELNKLAKGVESKYSKDLKAIYKLTDSELQSKSNNILHDLLHDFSKFSVSTIDKFFQKIIRSFTRELGIQPGYSIELAQDEILTKVIDELLLNLDTKNELKDWLSDLAFDNIEQGGKWDFKDDIQKLAKEIFKEEYKAFDLKLIQKMSDKSFLKNYIQELQKIKYQFEHFIISKSKEALELINNNGLTIDDFSNKASGPVGYFINAIDKNDFQPKSRFINSVDDVTKWYTKTSQKIDQIENLLNSGLHNIVKSIYSYYSENYINYYSSIEILNYIHTLGILTDISNKLSEFREEQNIFLISDAAKLIQTIVKDNDSPFIYEKTGNIYRHFMIDEFQDTSKIQWYNFKPLIENSLSQGSKNLVVGDVKQSIYRWRNSDWEILSDIIEKNFIHYNPDILSLNTNWRSKKNIINYNNAVFSVSSKILQQKFNEDFEESTQEENPYLSKINEAYEDVYQEIPKINHKDGGYIQHTFLTDKDPDSWKDKVKQNIPVVIENLQEKGYRLNDIAIIVRTKNEGQEIAQTLIDYKNQNISKYKFDFISNDSLFLANSSLVNFLLAILEFILNPDDDINLAFIAYEYYHYLNPEQNKEIHQILKKRDKENKSEWLSEIFPKEFIESIDQIKQLPIYELIDRIIRIFNLNKIESELPYLKAFLDIILDFSKKSTSDIHSFISWWNEEGNRKTLTVSENQNAIRIITIHSSKGLEFKNVIIPFCNWKIDNDTKQQNILWCKTEAEPFSQLDLIPVKYTNRLQNTVFKNDYLKEKFHAYIDNLNLLYVAFTRTEQNLFCFSPFKKKYDKITDVNDLLYSSYQNHKNYPVKDSIIDLSESWSDSVYELGKLSQAEIEEDQIINEFELKQFESYDIKNKLRLKLHDNSFFTRNENTPFQKVNHGKIMHELFENIKSEKDIPDALNKMIFEGKISPNQKQELIQKIEEIFKNEQIRNWFSDEWNVKTEAEIILTNGKTTRPDRVISNKNKTIVIDYKFGKQEEEKHHKQVKSYMDVLQKMEEKEIEGYLWYVDLNFIRQVE